MLKTLATVTLPALVAQTEKLADAQERLSDPRVVDRLARLRESNELGGFDILQTFATKLEQLGGRTDYNTEHGRSASTDFFNRFLSKYGEFETLLRELIRERRSGTIAPTSKPTPATAATSSGATMIFLSRLGGFP